MIAYRIENRKGYGPFSADFGESLCYAWSKCGYLMSEREEFGPWSIPDPYENGHQDLMDNGGIFAFNSLDILKKYFMLEIREELKCQFRVVVLDIDDNCNFTKDDVQICFQKEYSKIVDILDLETFESELFIDNPL